jgi:hypothetical protein
MRQSTVMELIHESESASASMSVSDCSDGTSIREAVKRISGKSKKKLPYIGLSPVKKAMGHAQRNLFKLDTDQID